MSDDVDEARDRAASLVKRDTALAGLFDALAELAREGVKFLGLAIENERASRGAGRP